MKKFVLPFFLFSLILSTGFMYAGSPSGSVSAAQKEVIVESLLNGLSSGNMGLMVSSAQFLAEYKSVRSVIPLMQMLHESENEESRIAAALALVKIGDSRGVFAVRQAAHFDESEQVRDMCMKFYCAYLCGKTDQ
ncbi:MAG: HEAT repeat domain-containing protein [Ignavibacteriaceae bacterium]|nr:HEAT repeat domain-containing protein [Ignavibacteriaceae bacterium]